jgi:hypothetical protein
MKRRKDSNIKRDRDQKTETNAHIQTFDVEKIDDVQGGEMPKRKERNVCLRSIMVRDDDDEKSARTTAVHVMCVRMKTTF